MSEEVKLSYGEILVGTNFNPSESPDVKKTKETFAKQIDILKDLSESDKLIDGGNHLVQREIAMAITNCEQTCMQVVKSFIFAIQKPKV